MRVFIVVILSIVPFAISGCGEKCDRNSLEKPFYKQADNCDSGTIGSSEETFKDAAEFNGSSSRFSLQHSGTNRSMSDAFTVEAFFILDTAPSSGNYRYIFQHYGSSDGYIALYIDDGRLLNFMVKINCAGNNTATLINTNALTLGQEYHVAATWDGVGGLKIYLNGVSQSTSSGLTPDTCSFSNLSVGAYTAGTNTNFFDGTIDEVRYSNSLRYSSDFTVPSAPYTSDGSSLILLKLNNNSSTAALNSDDATTLSTTSVLYNDISYVTSPF